jgi:hypothetical protein
MLDKLVLESKSTNENSARLHQLILVSKEELQKLDNEMSNDQDLQL